MTPICDKCDKPMKQTGEDEHPIFECWSCRRVASYTSRGLSHQPFTGLCFGCEDAVGWFLVRHPKTDKVFLLWPYPGTRFATVKTGSGNIIPGVAYCQDCKAAPGDPPPAEVLRQVPDADRITVIEMAASRYPAFFLPEYGKVLRAWLRDYMEMEDVKLEQIMAEWEQARNGALGG